MPAERDEMEPPQIAVQAFGGDAAGTPQEALDLAVAGVDRLDVHGPAHPLAGGVVDALVKNAERRGGGAMAATSVGDEQGVRGDHRRQRNAVLGAASRMVSPSGGSDRTAATLRHCAAVSSSILENQSRNCARSIVPLPMVNASWNPV